MGRGPGRPRIPTKERKQQVSISMLPADLSKVEGWAQRHGTTRSQIIFDALRALDGSIQDDLAHLRAELADQRATAERMRVAMETMKTEVARLQSSQELADAVITPYRSPDAKLTAQEKERARTLRAILLNPHNVRALELLVCGELEAPPTPIFLDLRRAWGSWEAAWQAVKAAKKATPEEA